MFENDIVEYNPGYSMAAILLYTTRRSTIGRQRNNSNNWGNGNAYVYVPPERISPHIIPTACFSAGTAANGWNGYRQAYFDGKSQGAVCWIGNSGWNMGTLGSYLFSLADQTVSNLILGNTSSGGGQFATNPLIVDYVRVYAADASSLIVTEPFRLEPGT